MLKETKAKIKRVRERERNIYKYGWGALMLKPIKNPLKRWTKYGI